MNAGRDQAARHDRCRLIIPSSGCFLGVEVVPTAACSDDRVSLFRSPAVALVGASPVVTLQDRIDRRPAGTLERQTTHV